ncbi:hypothetical protein AURDEDRAFT_158435 [Auricularia subglabra TFB-10046 SS5]|nr:hypothetical protein AURDEDRAFT_158435 [Auricularia subglabra TFB-10046 SS5]
MHVKEQAKLEFREERSNYIAAIYDALPEQRATLINNPPYKWRRFEEFGEYFGESAVAITSATAGRMDARGSQQEGSLTSPTRLRDPLRLPEFVTSPASHDAASYSKAIGTSIATSSVGAAGSRVASPPALRNASGPVATAPASSVDLDPPSLDTIRIGAQPRTSKTLLANYPLGSSSSRTITRDLSSGPTRAADSVAATSFRSPEPSPTLAVPEPAHSSTLPHAYGASIRDTSASAGRRSTKGHRKRTEAEMLKIDHHPAYFLQEKEIAAGPPPKRKRKMNRPLVESGSEEDPVDDDDDYNASEGSNAPDDYWLVSPKRKASFPSRPPRNFSHVSGS